MYIINCKYRQNGHDCDPNGCKGNLTRIELHVPRRVESIRTSTLEYKQSVTSSCRHQPGPYQLAY